MPTSTDVLVNCNQWRLDNKLICPSGLLRLTEYRSETHIRVKGITMDKHIKAMQEALKLIIRDENATAHIIAVAKRGLVGEVPHCSHCNGPHEDRGFTAGLAGPHNL